MYIVSFYIFTDFNHPFVHLCYKLQDIGNKHIFFFFFIIADKESSRKRKSSPTEQKVSDFF